MTNIAKSHQIIFDLLSQSSKDKLQILNWNNGVSLICFKKGVYSTLNTSNLSYELEVNKILNELCNAILSISNINERFKNFPFCIRRKSSNNVQGLYIYLGTGSIERHQKESFKLQKAKKLAKDLDEAAEEVNQNAPS